MVLPHSLFPEGFQYFPLIPLDLSIDFLEPGGDALLHPLGPIFQYSSVSQIPVHLQPLFHTDLITADPDMFLHFFGKPAEAAE